jgi:AAA+ superfamily predicted ATPase
VVHGKAELSPPESLPISELRELEILVLSHHPLVFLETAEEERAEGLLTWLTHSLRLPLFSWAPKQGLWRHGEAGPVYGTQGFEAALRHIAASNLEALYHFRYLPPISDDAGVVTALAAVERRLRDHRGAIVVTGSEFQAPAALAPLVARVRLKQPSDKEYHACVRSLLAEVRKRMRVAVELDGEQLAELLAHLRGLTLTEARRVLTQAMVSDGSLGARTLERVGEAKQKLVADSGVLEYFPADDTLEGVAGLENLKRWLTSRAAAFKQGMRAAEFGLSPPRGLLLLGVQGCGKSLCAKAVARAWSLPLLRLDPARLYNKYVGETERNLRSAIELAERLAPLVLWIDEIEKTFATSDNDGGASQRLLGTFLTWLQEKQPSVFVIATANDVTALPPELLRKGRFDEIFFVDLPDGDAREQILRVHLAKRGRDPNDYDLATLAALAEGYSGAELEQAIVAALYAAFEQGVELGTDHIARGLQATYPLSVTMREPVEALRAWAQGRTVSAD